MNMNMNMNMFEYNNFYDTLNNFGTYSEDTSRNINMQT